MDKKVNSKPAGFEKDEKESLIIAFVVCAIVILAVVLACVAIAHHKKQVGSGPVAGTTETVEADTAEAENTAENLGYVIVTNQEELDAALEKYGMEATEIIIQTDEEQSLLIQSGDYAALDLTIDAPNTEIENYGIFNLITILQIASNTWTERISGNSFSLNSAATHMIVPAGIEVTRIENMQAGSTVALEIDGTVNMLTMSSPNSIVSVKVEGSLKQVVLNSMANLTLSGSTGLKTAIDLGFDADNSVISTTIPVNVANYSDLTFTAEGGSEGSTVSIKSSTKSTTVSNNTSEVIEVITVDGTSQLVESGKEGIVFAADTGADAGTDQSAGADGGSNSSANTSTGNTNTTTTTNSGSSTRTSSSSSSTRTYSSSGSGTTTTSNSSTTTATGTGTASSASSSSDAAKKENVQSGEGYTKTEVDALLSDKDKKIESLENTVTSLQAFIDSLTYPTIIGFNTSATYNAGYFGAVKSLNTLLTEFPTSVQGYTAEGFTVTYPVSEWTNVDGYSLSAS